MKKTLSLFLALVLCLGLFACTSVCKHENWKPATCTTPKTCADCGAQEGNALGHDWKAATCTSAKLCKACYKTEGSKLSHNYRDGVCTRCGRADPNYTQLNWKDIFSGNPTMNLWMNSVGGIGFYWEHNYTGGKTVNYVTITYTLLDAVGNPIKDEITNKSTHSLRVIGPWTGDSLFYRGLGANFEALVYCKPCHTIRFDSLLLEYADGTFGVCTYGWQSTVS